MDKGVKDVDQNFLQVAERLPDPWKTLLKKIRPEQTLHITEIRLRSGCPVAVTKDKQSCFLAEDGTLLETETPGLPILSHQQLQDCFVFLCRYSVFTYESQLRQGFFTLPGGHRVGVAAQAAWDADLLLQPKNITSLNLRIARCIPLKDKPIWNRLLEAPVPKVLICGVPGSGKTTVLRGLTYELSHLGKRVAALDERCELFPVDSDGFCFPQPWNCDVFSGYPKTVAIRQALRALSPQVFVCDELGDSGEVEGLLDSLNSGVGFLATVHAGCREELLYKAQIQKLFAAHSLEKIVFLQDGQEPGRIREVQNVDS